MTVSRMLERNDFEQRFKTHQPISISEFLYPLMQGYDSVAIRADVELGGTDQEYNLLAARDIQIAYGIEPQVVLTTPLINGPNGTQKMSASLDNYIGIAEPPAEMYGKAMSAVDELMPQYYDLCLESDDPPPADPYLAKREFARRLVERWHGPEAAVAAEQGFDRQFKQGRAAEDAPVVPFPDADPVHMPAYLADNDLAALARRGPQIDRAGRRAYRRGAAAGRGAGCGARPAGRGGTPHWTPICARFQRLSQPAELQRGCRLTDALGRGILLFAAAATRSGVSLGQQVAGCDGAC